MLLEEKTVSSKNYVILNALPMSTKNKRKKKVSPKEKPIQPVGKASKVKEYSKKNFKNNWSNTKSVYTRPR